MELSVMRTMSCLLLFLSIPCMGVAESAKTTPCPIVPVPKEYKASGKTIVLPERNQEISIVLGEKCTEAEQYAAERLQTFVERRFGKILPIRLENEVDKEHKCVILLGRRSTNAWLDRLCKSNKIDLAPEKPGPDGFHSSPSRLRAIAVLAGTEIEFGFKDGG